MTHSKFEFIKQITKITGLAPLSMEDQPTLSILKFGKLAVVEIFHTDSGWRVWHVRINSDVERELTELHLGS